jgi:hypothetical protein
MLEHAGELRDAVMLDRQQALPIHGRYDSLLPAFGCKHLLSDDFFLHFVKGVFLK